MSVLSDRDLQILRDREKRGSQREKENQEGTYEHYQKFMQSDEVKEHRRQLLREMRDKLIPKDLSSGFESKSILINETKTICGSMTEDPVVKRKLKYGKSLIETVRDLEKQKENK